MSETNVTDSPQASPAVACSDLLGVLGNTVQARELTAEKTKSIVDRFEGAQVSGFVVTLKGGNLCIVDKSACRWLTKEELWWLMHESDELPPKTPNNH